MLRYIFLSTSLYKYRCQPGGHSNPVEAGFVEKAEDWLYSSAGNFYGKKELIELAYII